LWKQIRLHALLVPGYQEVNNKTDYEPCYHDGLRALIGDITLNVLKFYSIKIL
jgi:hypothetical protein